MDESAMRLTARVAPYIDAIKQKRAAGWRWKDVTLALGFACSDHSLAQAVKSCKWVAEQREIPNAKPAAAASAEHREAGNGKRALPRVDDVQDGEDGGLTEAERILKSIPHL